MNLADLYEQTHVATPARSEDEWQERHSSLPLDASVYAGDRYSTQRYRGVRRIVTDRGDLYRALLVDEYGRSWQHRDTLWPIEVYP